jgi:hypothetical protein
VKGFTPVLPVVLAIGILLAAAYGLLKHVLEAFR